MSVVFMMDGHRMPDSVDISRYAMQMAKIVAQRWPVRDEQLGCWWKSIRVPYDNKHGYISVQVAFDPSTHRWSKRYYEALRASQAPE